MKTTVAFTLDKDLIEKLDKLAVKESRSRSNLVNQILKKYIENTKD